jgi:hypothetical protein
MAIRCHPLFPQWMPMSFIDASTSQLCLVSAPATIDKKPPMGIIALPVPASLVTQESRRSASGLQRLFTVHNTAALGRLYHPSHQIEKAIFPARRLHCLLP